MRRLGVVIYIIGLTAGILLGGLMAWADLEASLFSPDPRAEEAIKTLSCPVIISKQETAIVKASFENPSELPRKVLITARFSDGFVTLIREEETRIELAPGEKRKLEWPATREDAAWEWLILARVSSGRTSPIPPRTASCGILVIATPVNGRVLLGILVSTVPLMMGGGLLLWRKASQPMARKDRTTATAMGLSVLFTLIAVITGLIGWWQLTILILVMALLLIISFVSWLLLSG